MTVAISCCLGASGPASINPVLFSCCSEDFCKGKGKWMVYAVDFRLLKEHETYFTCLCLRKIALVSCHKWQPRKKPVTCLYWQADTTWKGAANPLPAFPQQSSVADFQQCVCALGWIKMPAVILESTEWCLPKMPPSRGTITRNCSAGKFPGEPLVCCGHELLENSWAEASLEKATSFHLHVASVTFVKCLHCS